MDHRKARLRRQRLHGIGEPALIKFETVRRQDLADALAQLGRRQHLAAALGPRAGNHMRRDLIDRRGDLGQSLEAVEQPQHAKRVFARGALGKRLTLKIKHHRHRQRCRAEAAHRAEFRDVAVHMRAVDVLNAERERLGDLLGGQDQHVLITVIRRRRGELLGLVFLERNVLDHPPVVAAVKSGSCDRDGRCDGGRARFIRTIWPGQRRLEHDGALDRPQPIERRRRQHIGKPILQRGKH